MSTQAYSNLKNEMMDEDGPPEVITSQKPQQMQPQLVSKPVTPTYVMATTTVQTINPNSIDGNYRPGWAHKSALILSIIIMISGGIMLIMNIASLAMGIKNYIPGTGIWGGVAIIVIGGIGVGASKRKSKCLIIAVMVLTIILAAGSILLCSQMIGIIMYASSGKEVFDPEYAISGLAIIIVITICFLVATVSAIVMSALTCRAVCCQPNSFMVQAAYAPPAGSCNLAPATEELTGQGEHKEAILDTPQVQLQPQYIQNQVLMQP